MISDPLARALRTAGLRWHPASGDRFRIETSERSEGADEPDDAGDEIYTVSDMTAEVHEHPTGSLIGFNGTTEWALDSVDLGDTLWLPREDQLREILRDGFVSLAIDRTAGEPLYLVTATILGETRVFEARIAADAYAEAVLDLIVQSTGLGWEHD